MKREKNAKCGARYRGDSWIVNGKWIAPGRNQREAIDYLQRCGVVLNEHDGLVLVWRFEG